MVILLSCRNLIKQDYMWCLHQEPALSSLTVWCNPSMRDDFLPTHHSMSRYGSSGTSCAASVWYKQSLFLCSGCTAAIRCGHHRWVGSFIETVVATSTYEINNWNHVTILECKRLQRAMPWQHSVHSTAFDSAVNTWRVTYVMQATVK